jgi:hypothetical protein
MITIIIIIINVIIIILITFNNIIIITFYFNSKEATGVTVTVSNQEHELYSVTALLNVTAQAFGKGWGTRPCPKAVCPPYDMKSFTPFGKPLSSWKALLKPMPAGGDFIITAQCLGCSANSSSRLTLSNVTFGDVWYCSGQSNMWLPVLHSFSRNQTALSIWKGKFTNIRVMAGGSGSTPYGSWPPKYGALDGSNPWMTAAQATPYNCTLKQNCPLFNVGASCWYFAQGLAEAGLHSPIGIIDTAIGGQRIEEFMDNSTWICSDLAGSNIPWWNGQLFGQQVLPFVDFTIKGWVWYQGENNMGSTKGNSNANVGYGCAVRELILGWRRAWARTPGTTDLAAPFGTVTLANSGSEGGPNMG